MRNSGRPCTHNSIIPGYYICFLDIPKTSLTIEGNTGYHLHTKRFECQERKTGSCVLTLEVGEILDQKLFQKSKNIAPISFPVMVRADHCGQNRLLWLEAPLTIW